MTYKYNPRTEEPSYTTAIKQLRPRLADNNIEYHMDGKGNVVYWEDREKEPPTREEVNQEYQRQLKEFAEQAFYRMRKQSLPALTIPPLNPTCQCIHLCIQLMHI